MLLFYFVIVLLMQNLCFGSETESDVAEKLYIKLFKKQRVEQLEALKSFRKISNYEKQYKMLVLMSDKVFSVIQESRAALEASSYIPGVSDFPMDEEVRNALSNILENTALFSEIVLRFPDIATLILKSNNNWEVILQWGITFSNQMKYLLDNSTVTLLHLVSQELNIIEREANYVNPYRDTKTENEVIVEDRKVPKKKKSIRKGPKLSNIEL